MLGSLLRSSPFHSRGIKILGPAGSGLGSLLLLRGRLWRRLGRWLGSLFLLRRRWLLGLISLLLCLRLRLLLRRRLRRVPVGGGRLLGTRTLSGLLFARLLLWLGFPGEVLPTLFRLLVLLLKLRPQHLESLRSGCIPFLQECKPPVFGQLSLPRVLRALVEELPGGLKFR